MTTIIGICAAWYSIEAPGGAASEIFMGDTDTSVLMREIVSMVSSSNDAGLC